MELVNYNLNNNNANKESIFNDHFSTFFNEIKKIENIFILNYEINNNYIDILNILQQQIYA